MIVRASYKLAVFKAQITNRPGFRPLRGRRTGTGHGAGGGGIVHAPNIAEAENPFLFSSGKPIDYPFGSGNGDGKTRPRTGGGLGSRSGSDRVPVGPPSVGYFVGDGW